LPALHRLIEFILGITEILRLLQNPLTQFNNTARLNLSPLSLSRGSHDRFTTFLLIAFAITICGVVPCRAHHHSINPVPNESKPHKRE
jgi:hypothetical protein